MIQLKPAGLQEASALLDIQRQAFAPLLEKYRDYGTNPAMEPLESLERKLREKDYYFILDGGTPVGLAGVRRMADRRRISPIGLLPKCCGQGIGRQAMLLLEARYPDAVCWELDTIHQEPGLCRFYEGLGYWRTGGAHQIQPGMLIVDYEKTVNHRKG